MIDEKKLIERLEEELKLADEVKEKCSRENQLMFDNAKGYATGISNEISIVNQLAEEYNNDVCEWKDTKEGIFRIVTSCRRSLKRNDDYEFCPYCGKKIKVVEWLQSEVE